MPAGTCDPASRGQTWNEGEMVQGTQPNHCSVRYRYGWDGVSVRPDCVGPLNRVQLQNFSTSLTWYAHFKGRRGQPRRLDMPPGFVATFNSGQLSSRGFTDNTDLETLYITLDPNPPTNW